MLGEEDGHGVGLLARRAPGGPHADGVVRALPLEELRDDLRFQNRERAHVAEEVGDRDEEVLEEVPRLVAVGLEEVGVVVERVGPDDVEPALQPPQHRAPLVAGEVVAGPDVELAEDPLDGPDVVGGERARFVRREAGVLEPV